MLCEELGLAVYDLGRMSFERFAPRMQSPSWPAQQGAIFALWAQIERREPLAAGQ
jgi:hypothetical protein